MKMSAGLEILADGVDARADPMGVNSCVHEDMARYIRSTRKFI